VSDESPSPTPERGEELASRLFDALDDRHVAAIEAAKAFVLLVKEGHLREACCASTGEYLGRHGYAPGEARELHMLGVAMAKCEGLEDEVREGRVSVRSAAMLAEVFAHASYGGDPSEWFEAAKTLSEIDLRRKVDQWKEEAAHGRPAIRLTIHVTAKAKADFDRGRVLLSRTLGHPATYGQTLGAMARHYVAAHDVLERKEGTRRAPDTTGRPGRTKPAHVRRVVMLRNGDRCAVPGCCNRMFLEDAHVIARRWYGGQEIVNILRLCTRHHRLFDGRRILLVGPADRPIFVDRSGCPLMPGAWRRSRPGEAREAPGSSPASATPSPTSAAAGAGGAVATDEGGATKPDSTGTSEPAAESPP
jgi:hypothetical protein